MYFVNICNHICPDKQKIIHRGCWKRETCLSFSSQKTRNLSLIPSQKSAEITVILTIRLEARLFTLSGSPAYSDSVLLLSYSATKNAGRRVVAEDLEELGPPIGSCSSAEFGLFWLFSRTTDVSNSFCDFFLEEESAAGGSFLFALCIDAGERKTADSPEELEGLEVCTVAATDSLNSFSTAFSCAIFSRSIFV